MSKDNLKKTFYWLGMAGAFVAGLAFVLLCDIVIKIGSMWLFASILLSLGSGICEMLSETFREKRKTCIALKGAALGLAIAFIGFLPFFRFGPLISFETNREKGLSLIITIICVAITLVALVGQIGDLALTVKNKEDIVDEKEIIGQLESDNAVAENAQAAEVNN